MKDLRVRKKATNLAGWLVMVLLLSVFPACNPLDSTLLTPAPTSFVEASPTPIDEMPYKGDGSKYVYIMKEERDRKWEEDIVYFADFYLNYLHGHPKLTDRTISVREFRYSSGKLGSQSRGQNNTNFLDKALRETFITEVNGLILGIPSLNDREITISMQRIVALLKDAHSNVFFPADTFLGIFAGPLHTQTSVEYGILFARREYASLLMSRLNGINGVPISEIMERIRPLLSKDRDINYQDRACGYYYLSNPDVLRYIGVMSEKDTAVLSLIGLDGKEYEYTVTASSTENWNWNDYVEYVSSTGNDSGDIGIYSCRASNFIIYGAENYWYKTVSNGKSVYIRLNNCPNDENIKTFFQTAFSSVDPAELEKVIIDFRFNDGGDGNMDGGFGTLLSLIQASKAEIYVLINGTSMSAATIVPALLKQYAEKITLVGSPTGQGIRVFHHSNQQFNSAIVPNSGIIVYCSNMFSDAWPGYDEPTLMPDVEIDQSFEDYRNGIDSVLKYILMDDQQ